MNVKWVRDLKVEHFLKKLKVDFKVESIKLADIDLDESLEKQTRIGKKINEGTVVEYAEAMMQGSAFPHTIVNKLKHRAWFLSGNHRGHAAQLCDQAEIEAYTVQVTDPRLVEIIPRTINALEGMRPSREEMLAHAIHLMETLRMEPKDAGKLLGLRPEWITVAKRTQDIQAMVREEGINPEGISKSLFIKMSPLANNRNVLKATARLIKSHEVGFEEAVQLIEDVKAGTTEAERLQVLKDWGKTFKDREDPHPVSGFRTSTRTQFLQLVTRLDRLLAQIARVTELQLSEADRQEIPAKWQRVQDNFRRLMFEKEAGANDRK